MHSYFAKPVILIFKPAFGQRRPGFQKFLVCVCVCVFVCVYVCLCNTRKSIKIY